MLKYVYAEMWGFGELIRTGVMRMNHMLRVLRRACTEFGQIKQSP
jgi:hypothetical protein